MPESMGRKFRRLLEDEPYLFTGGVYQPLDAQIAEQVGMKSIYLSGYSMALANAWPDMGFLTQTEVARIASMVASATTLPVIADADDGYGNALSTIRTVQEFAKTGVAGIHLEDQRFPKRCGHIAGKTVVSLEEALGKYRAAIDTRDRLDRDFVIIARTDAISAVGLDEALHRGEAVAEAGADVLFIEAPRTEAQVERVARAFDTPLLYNYAPGGRSPLPPFARLRELGFAIILLPVDTLLVAVQAMRGFLAEARARDDVLALADRYMPFADFNELIGVTAQLALAERYRADERSAT